MKLITKDEYKTAQDDISKTYKYLFVDEFQDCSPTQIKIFDRLSDKMDKLGTCIHDIFCVIENNKDESFIKHIIQNHAMENVLQDASEIKIAWNNLENFLVEKYGKKTNSYHELPFKQQYEGQIFTGSIDLVWEGENGVVLIDYKSYPGNKDDVVNPEHAHFAGIYSGQFACYERALNAAGKRVIGRIIYYHVLGVGVELEIQE